MELTTIIGGERDTLMITNFIEKTSLTIHIGDEAPSEMNTGGGTENEGSSMTLSISHQKEIMGFGMAFQMKKTFLPTTWICLLLG